MTATLKMAKTRAQTTIANKPQKNLSTMISDKK